MSGSVTLNAGGDVTLQDNISADAKGNAGTISVSSATVTLPPNADVTARSSTSTAGTLQLSATGAVSLGSKHLTLTGDTGGVANVTGSTVTVSPLISAQVDGTTAPGEMHFQATTGNLTLTGGVFTAKTAGGIEAAAPLGNLTASGDF